MLTLVFPVQPGESLVYSRAQCFRFCADGTLRGGDNFIAATRLNDSWRLGHRLYRTLECGGPVLLRARKTAVSRPVGFGPFPRVWIAAGLLCADDSELRILLPSWAGMAVDLWHEVMLLPAPASS